MYFPTVSGALEMVEIKIVDINGVNVEIEMNMKSSMPSIAIIYLILSLLITGLLNAKLLERQDLKKANFKEKD